MTNAQIGYGSKIARSDDGGTTWVDFIEAKTAGVPSTETDYHEVTSLDSPNGFKEYIPGLRDGGTIDIKSVYTPAGYAIQIADQASGDLILYRTTFATGEIFKFKGYPTASIDDVGENDARTMTTKIRVSGDVTYTAAS